MGIKFNEKTGFWEAFHSQRHPITRVPHSFRLTKLKTETEARRKEMELVAKLDRKLQETIKPRLSKVIDEALDNCIATGMYANTVNIYKYCLYAHIMPMWGHKRIEEITTDQIRSYIISLRETKSVSHQKNILKYIRMVFKFAHEKGYINRNPTPQMKFRIVTKIKKCLNLEQIRHFLNKAKDMSSEWYPVWTVAIYTGMRNGELYALTWDKVDLENRLIKVDTAWNNKDGFKSTKSGDDRMVEIAPNLLPILKELKLAKDNHPFVLPRIPKWDDGYQSEALRHFLIGTGLPAIRFHDLRASWATVMMANGVEPIKVMAMGGWKDIKTMMIYMRKAGLDIRGTTDNLDLHSPAKKQGKVLSGQFGS